jgi:hypothetical protein
MTMTSERLLSPDLVSWFNDRWTPAMGAIDGYDLRFIASLLDEAKPHSVVEIGCASGLSTAMIGAMLEKIGPAAICSFDLGKRFYADPSKPVGYLIAEAAPRTRVSIELVTGRACLAVPERYAPGTIDFCFIDASHQHPWPLIDTLVVLPLMREGAYVVHHDPQMATNPSTHATGPKLLQLLLPPEVAVPFASRVAPETDLGLKVRHISDNIFALRRPIDIRPLASRLAQGFMLGWDTPHVPWRNARIEAGFAERLTQYLHHHYTPDVARAFQVGMQRYNTMVKD